MKARDAEMLQRRVKRATAPALSDESPKQTKRAPRRNVEQGHHRTVAEFLDLFIGPRKWFHAANERANETERAILSGLGVKSGVPDIIVFKRLPCGGPGLAIEMKAPERKREDDPLAGTTPAQSAMLASMAEEGWLTAVCYSADEAMALVRATYGASMTKPDLSGASCQRSCRLARISGAHRMPTLASGKP